MWNDEHQNDYPSYQPPVIHHTTSPLIEGVVVPLLQALASGVFTGLAALALAAWLKLPYWGVGATAFTLAALGSWLSYRGRWQWTLERVLGVDINRDGYIGQPKPERAQSLRVELIQEEGRRGEYIDLPYPEKIPLLASGLLQGRQFSQVAWTGRGQLFSRAEFETLRAELLKRGLATWNNPEAPAQGITLTGPGRAIFRRLADHSPTLPGGSGSQEG